MRGTPAAGAAESDTRAAQVALYLPAVHAPPTAFYAAALRELMASPEEPVSLIAEANLTARNEDTTPGASLWGFEIELEGERMTLALDIDNLLNKAWLDHVSAYRTLGLVTQGRWASLRLTINVAQPDDRV